MKDMATACSETGEEGRECQEKGAIREECCREVWLEKGWKCPWGLVTLAAGGSDKSICRGVMRAEDRNAQRGLTRRWEGGPRR